MEEKENNNEKNDIQSLIIDYKEEKKEEEDFDTKMNSLFTQLDPKIEKVKRYAIMDVPLSQIEINKYKFNYNFKPDNNYNNINSNKLKK